MAVPCKNVLENALGRQISDSEFKVIEQDFKKAAQQAGQEFGKGFSTLPKADKAKLIADKLNENRSKSLTNIETQLLANNNITDLNADLKSTLGQSLESIAGKELADNINNMIGSTLTRSSFLKRGGGRITFDTAIKTISNRLGKAFLRDYLRDFSKVVDVTGLKKNDAIERGLADKIVNTNYLDNFYAAINNQYAAAGINKRVTSLDMAIARDDIVYFNRNAGSIDKGADAFEAFVSPLLKKDNTVDLKALYRDLVNKVNELEGEGGPISNVNALKFKDGQSLLDFIRKFSSTKDITTHTTATMDNAARTIAAKKTFGDEDIAGTITRKLATETDEAARRKLQRTLIAYQEVTGATTRDYTKGIYDLSISLIKNWVSAQWLGRSAIKGTVTDSIHAGLIAAAKGDVKGLLTNDVATIANLAKSADDLSLFYNGMDEWLAGTQHYMNNANQGVLSTDSFTNALQRGNRKTKNLAASVQSAQAQNLIIKAKKRALAATAERLLFNPKFDVELSDSLSAITHAQMQKLGFKGINDLYDLDLPTYNKKMGTSVSEAEFVAIKNDLELEIEGAIIHQVQGTQIDSGSVSTQAQTARILGDQNSNVRRFVAPILLQFQTYSQNFLLKSQLIRGLLGSDTIAGKLKYAGAFMAMMILAGYSNLNVTEALKAGVEDPEWHDPLTDIDDGEYYKLLMTLVSGSSLPLTKQAEVIVTEGKVTGLAPSVAYAVGVGGALAKAAVDQDAEAFGKLQDRSIGFNLPFMYDFLQWLKTTYGGE